MAETTGAARRRLAWVMALIIAVVHLVGCAQSSGGNRRLEHAEETMRILPWEWWRDLSTVASISDGDRVVMRSSHCPSGCEYDRHSEDNPRFLRLRKNGEGVIFSAEGAGAVTRIWMVMGDGVSEPLDGSVRLRVRIDGRRRPVVDLPLNELFAGTAAPFLEPLVADRTMSGGGNVSYVPIPFREGCEITLVGAESVKIWFQVTARLVGDSRGVRSFTGGESLDGLRSVLQRFGNDPWPGRAATPVSGSIVLGPGEGKAIASFDGPDLINGIIIRTPRKNWHRLGLRFTFDDREAQLYPVVDLFGRVGGEGGVTRSLFVGGDTDDDLYCYFPMPFFEGAEVELVRRLVEGPPRVEIEYALRTAGVPPPADAGYFGVQIRRNGKSASGSKLKLVELEGRGSLVGLVTEMSSSDGKGWGFLEGDEQVFINGEETPSWHGTGVEDFFNGGFYFRDQTGKPAGFATALAGVPYVHGSIAKTVMYRLLLGDAIVFQDGIRAELETGPTGELSVRARSVAYFYAARETESGEVLP